MASKFMRRQKWWIKFRDPATGEVVRESLETPDKARAELLRQRLELEIALLEPRFQAAEIPGGILARLGRASVPIIVNDSVPVAVSAPVIRQTAKRTSLDEAVATYLKFIASDNAPLHVANKLSIFRRFLGWERVEKIAGPSKQRPTPAMIQRRPAPFFDGKHLDEITAALVQRFIEGLTVGRMTKRHYRECFHHFFEVCLKFDLYQPANWHRPNPIAALPGYITRNRRIVFLTEEQVREQIDVLRDHPGMQIAAAIMIFAGPRRSEALWLTKDSIAKDLSFLSILNRIDEDDEFEGSLKTGQRAVSILPQLRGMLEEYLPTLKSRWVIPNPKGKRWSADGFGRKLRILNQAHGLKWRCMHFRHTYATHRAADGWPLFRIAKEMGNSVAVVEEHYAAFAQPAGYTAAD